MTRTRTAFISVGAVCQALLRLVGSWAVLRHMVAAGRADSSLRSHRTRRSQCRRVCSGLNKTLFALVGQVAPPLEKRAAKFAQQDR
jgi:hypothetical protein